MSLYNMIFGMNPDADRLLAFLGQSRDDFGRFRNVYLKDGYIVVHTRNGGGNREFYQYVFDQMSEHPWYSHDEDDDFDCTYAKIYFRIPDAQEETVIRLLGLDAGRDPSDQWQELFGQIKDLSKSS